MMKPEPINIYRVGICRELDRKVLQVDDETSDDAVDEPGWLCIHRDTIEEEIAEMIEFLYGFNEPISAN